MDEIRFLDLFGGVGGFRLGLERANGLQGEGRQIQGLLGQREDVRGSGIQPLQDIGGDGNGERGEKADSGRFRCISYIEFDKNAVQVYNRNFGERHEPTDARRVDPHALPDFDLLCAGFPCQSHSLAGKRAGLQDPRGELFFEIARIAQVRHPRLLLLENVLGLLSSEWGAAFRKILATLDEVGYDAEWEVLNSKHFGVPQNRERVFIVGHLRGEPWREVFPLGQGPEVALGARQAAQGGGEWVRSVDSNYHKGGARQMIANQTLELAPPFDPDGSRVPEAERAYLTKGLSPAVKEMGINVYESGLIHSRGFETRKDGVNHSLKGGGGGSSKNFLKIERLDEAESIEHRVYGADGLAPALPTASTGGNLVPKVSSGIDTSGYLYHPGHHESLTKARIRRLTPTECERLQGFPDGWTSGASDTQRYRMMGNAVTVNVIEAIGRRILEATNSTIGGTAAAEEGRA